MPLSRSLGLALQGCSRDSTTAPQPQVTFLPLSAAVLNVLIVDHLDAHTATTATLTEIESDDDSGSNANALLSVPLTAGQDYFVKVIGWADDVIPPNIQMGPYTMTFTGP